MTFLQRPLTTLKDSQRLGGGIGWRSISATSNDHERPPTTLSFHLCHMETYLQLANANHPERPPTTGSE